MVWEGGKEEEITKNRMKLGALCMLVPLGFSGQPHMHLAERSKLLDFVGLHLSRGLL